MNELYHGIFNIHFNDKTTIASGAVDVDKREITIIFKRDEDFAFLISDNTANNQFYVTGTLLNGLPCTFYDCFKSPANYILNGLITIKLHFNICITGASLKTKQKQKFSAVSIRFSCLDNLVPYHIHSEYIQECDTHLCFGIDKNHYLGIQAPKNEKRIYLYFDEEKYLDEIDNLVFCLRCCFTIIFGKHINIDGYYLYTDCGLDGNYVDLFQTQLIQKNYSDKEQHYNTVIFNKIENHFFTTWFNIYTKYQFQIKTIFDVLCLELSSETGFMACLHAIEGFHRIKETETTTLSGNYMDRTEYENINTPLYSSISNIPLSPDHRTSLKNRIKYGYQKSLRSRLKDLQNFLGSAIVKFYKINSPSGNDKQYYTNTLIELRNYFAHLDPSTDESIKNICSDFLEIYNYKISALAFLHSLILNELIIDKNILMYFLKEIRFAYTEDFYNLRIDFKPELQDKLYDTKIFKHIDLLKFRLAIINLLHKLYLKKMENQS